MSLRTPKKGRDIKAPTPIGEIMAGIIPCPPKVIHVLWAYLDEAGLNPAAKAVTVGGLVCKKSRWKQVEKEWSRRLPEGIDAFHAQPCRFGHKPFKEMSEVDRMALYDDLAAILAREQIQIVSGSVLLEGWNGAKKDPVFSDRYPTPYSLAFDLCLSTINSIGKKTGKKMGVVYAISDAYVGRAELVGQALVSSERYSEWIKTCSPNRPQTVVPLQAADMICHEIYHQHQKFDFAGNDFFKLMSRLDPFHIGHYYDKAAIEELVRSGPIGFID